MVCQDCIKFLTDAQAEAKANTSFVDTLMANLENQCDLLGPSLSEMVRTTHHRPHLDPDVYIWMSVYEFSCVVLQCKEYISEYGSLVFQQLMSMVSEFVCPARVKPRCNMAAHYVPLILRYELNDPVMKTNRSVSLCASVVLSPYPALQQHPFSRLTILFNFFESFSLIYFRFFCFLLSFFFHLFLFSPFIHVVCLCFLLLWVVCAAPQEQVGVSVFSL